MEKTTMTTNKPIPLSRRMLALANLISPGHRLADVGCDHGYLPIFLCQTGRIPSASAMDGIAGPLVRATAHIRLHGLEGRIQTRLSDGLAALQEDEADTILIAGMGGWLVHHILTAVPLPQSVTELILQPQSEIALVRNLVRRLDFDIVDEEMIQEEGKFYPMMRALPRATTTQTAGEKLEILPQEIADAFGPILLQKKHPVLQEWMQQELSSTTAILSRLEADTLRKAPEQINEKTAARITELRQKKTQLNQGLALLKA